MDAVDCSKMKVKSKNQLVRIAGNCRR